MIKSQFKKVFGIVSCNSKILVWGDPPKLLQFEERNSWTQVSLVPDKYPYTMSTFHVMRDGGREW